MQEQPTEEREIQDSSWLYKQWERVCNWCHYDAIIAQIGTGARGVIVGKNIIQIGALSIPIWIALSGLLIFLFIFLLLLYQVVVPWLPRTMPEGSFNIAVAEFTVIGLDVNASAKSEAREISISIANFLKTQTDSFSQVVGEQVVIWGPTEGIPFITPNKEAELTSLFNIDVLIYGQLYLDRNEQWQVEPHFYLTSEVVRQATELYGDHALGNLITYRPNNQASKRDINAALRTRVEALSQLLLGLAYIAFGDRNGYQKASEVFANTVETSEWANSLERTGQEVLYLFLGNSMLRLSYLTEDTLPERMDLLNRSRVAFEESLARNPNYARGYNGLGSVLFQIARPPVHENACTWNWELLQVAESNFNRAVNLPESAKPYSGYVDYYAHFGLGRVAFWDGYCQHAERWLDAENYYFRALEEYIKIDAPVTNLIDVATFINTDLGFMSLLQAESEERNTEKAKTGFSKSIDYYTKALQLARDSNSEESRRHTIEIMPYYLTALCLNHDGQRAMEDLNRFIEEFPEPAEVKASILELTNQDLWRECHAQGI